MEIPELSDATEGLTEAAQEARSLISWLPDPHVCESCNEYCKATVVFDPRMVEYTDAWECPSCGQAYYRDEPWNE